MSKIIVTHEFPPIPNRSFDYRAYRDSDEEITRLHGWGRTKDEALANLSEILTEEEDGK